ncbi:unnamed protein product [Arctogadus glacialis]
MRLLTVTALLSLLLEPVFPIAPESVTSVTQGHCCYPSNIRRQHSLNGLALQIQCYQCEEMTRNECSTPEFVVNCTVNVQDMCQKEVLVKEDGESA